MDTPGAVPLTIISVCLNNREGMKKTCESVSGQTWRHFEWIVVDGASSDGTLEMLDSYRDRIDALVSERDHGIYEAMNKGIRLARGEWLLFLNGGDRLASDTALESVFAGGRHDADVLYTDVFEEEGGEIIRLRRIADGKEMDGLFFAHDTICHQASLIRRELFDAHGLYDENLSMVSDWKKWIEFQRAGRRFQKIDGAALSVFDVVGVSTKKRNRVRRQKEIDLVRAEFFHPDELRRAAALARAGKAYRVVKSGMLPFLRLPLWTVKESPDARKRKYCLFGLPALKRKAVSPTKSRYHLFSVFPVTWLLKILRILKRIAPIAARFSSTSANDDAGAEAN